MSKTSYGREGKNECINKRDTLTTFSAHVNLKTVSYIYNGLMGGFFGRGKNEFSRQYYSG